MSGPSITSRRKLRGALWRRIPGSRVHRGYKTGSLLTTQPGLWLLPLQRHDGFQSTDHEEYGYLPIRFNAMPVLGSTVELKTGSGDESRRVDQSQSRSVRAGPATYCGFR